MRKSITGMFLAGVIALTLVGCGSGKEEKAQEKSCSSNIKQLITALHLFATDHNGILPKNLLEQNKDLSYEPGTYVCPKLISRAASSANNMTEANVTYEFLCPGKKLDDLSSDETPIIRCTHHQGKTIMGFADGHVEIRKNK